MRFVVVQPGADYSTHDVYEGLCAGLVAEGHEVRRYDLGVRLDMAEHARQALLLMAANGAVPLRDVQVGRSEILLEAGNGVYPQIIEMGADALIVIDGTHWAAWHSLLVHKAGLPVVVIGTEAPYTDAAMIGCFGVADLVTVQERASVPRLAEAMERCERRTLVRYLPAAALEPHEVAEAPADVPAWDVLFVGTYFAERIAILEDAHQRGAFRGLRVGLYGSFGLLRAPRWIAGDRKRPAPTPFRIAVLGALARLRAPGVSPLWQYVRGGVIPNGTAREMYRRAQINLSLNRTSQVYAPHPVHAPGESLNPRQIELAMEAAFTLSEHRAEVEETFGELMPTFRDGAGLARLIATFTGDPLRAARLAAQLPAAVQEMTYRHRARDVVTFVREILDTRRATPSPPEPKGA